MRRHLRTRLSGLSRPLLWGALTLALVGCAPLAGLGSWPAGLVVLALGLVLGSTTLQPSANATPPIPTTQATPPAGPPPPPPTCSGSWHSSCVNGTIKKSCCPKGAKCNYAYAPHVDCGNNRCVSGHDIGMCPAPEPVLLHEANSAEICDNKHGSWERACVQGITKMACIRPVPTNYMGPPRNPKFFACQDNRCTTGKVRAACYPTKDDAKRTGQTECKGTWRKTCVEGKIAERCLPRPPTNYSGVFYKSTEFVDCGEDRCVLGKDKWRCGR